MQTINKIAIIMNKGELNELIITNLKRININVELNSFLFIPRGSEFIEIQS